MTPSNLNDLIFVAGSDRMACRWRRRIKFLCREFFKHLNTLDFREFLQLCFRNFEPIHQNNCLKTSTLFNRARLQVRPIKNLVTPVFKSILGLNIVSLSALEISGHRLKGSSLLDSCRDKSPEITFESLLFQSP